LNMDNDQPMTIDEFKLAIQDAILDALSQFTTSQSSTGGNASSGSLVDLCDCMNKNTGKITQYLNVFFYQSIEIVKSLRELNGALTTVQTLILNQQQNTGTSSFPTNPPPGKGTPNWWSRFKGGLANAPVGNAAGTIQGGADLLSMIPKIGGAIGGVVAFGAMLFRGTQQLSEWGRSLHSANIQFAEFSGSMAVVQTESALRQALLSQERGERRAESAKGLAEANDQFSRALAPLEDAFSNGWNNVVGWLEKRVTPVLEWLNRRFGIDNEKVPKIVPISEALYALAKETIKDNEYGNYDAFK